MSLGKTRGNASLQNRIYHSGSAPRWSTDLRELEAAAEEVLSPQARAYLAAAAGTGATLRANRAALDAWSIVPRVLTGGGWPSLATTICGTPAAAPIMIGPLGLAALAHPDADHALARAAAQTRLPMVLSSAASTPLETAAGLEAVTWFELVPTADPRVSFSLLDRAADAGYDHLMIAVDMPALGWRPQALNHAVLPFLPGQGGRGLDNYTADPEFTAAAGDRDYAEHWAEIATNPYLNWDAVADIRERWDGFVVLKGIQRPEDARRAVEAGADAVVVSNHGGRQVDGGIGAAAALPGVVDEVGAEIQVLFDSGIRSGADIVKALALGARAVLVGRPVLWGVALGWTEGVQHVLDCLCDELQLTLTNAGYSLDTLSRDALRPSQHGGSHG